MRFLDLTLPTPVENLALDEALLDEAEQECPGAETLRVWEPPAPLVVVGRSSRIQEEVDLEGCRRLGIPVLRRSSGGAAIVAGPGCLMYALVLSCRERPALRAVDQAHRLVLDRLAGALARHLAGVRCQGTSDLALGDRKFSGNSIRAKRDHLLYHGTILYDFPLEFIERCLLPPPRQPEYRAGRGHEAFLTNLRLEAATIRQALAAAWDAAEPCDRWPQSRTAQLVAERYGRPEWNRGR